MKKVLLIHNKYQDLGGEDIAVENEIKLLEKHFDIKVIYFSNVIESIFKQAFYFLLNRNLDSEKKLIKEIKDFKPDVAYVHNTWFKASLGIFSVLRKYNIKTILKIHNFRYDCTRYFLSSKHFNEKQFCQKCGSSRKDMNIFNKYYKDSFIKSLLINYYGKRYFKIIKKSNFKIFVLTKFHKNHLINLGFKEKRLKVFPNFIEQPNLETRNYESNNFVYAGRISKEKGIEELIQVFLSTQNPNFILQIIGKGPEYVSFSEKYKNSKIQFLGEMSNEDVLNHISKSYMVITTTKLFEGQPTLLCEASSLGVPSIFPSTGGINEFFPEDYKLSFEQFDYEDLKNTISFAMSNTEIKNFGIENNNFIKRQLNEISMIENMNKFLNDE